MIVLFPGSSIRQWVYNFILFFLCLLHIHFHKSSERITHFVRQTFLRKLQDNMGTICLAYDSLLSKFPLCHWYWKRYAYETVRLSDPNKAVEIFEWALSLGMYSLGLWLDYCLFGMSFFEDKDVVRR